MNGNDDGPGWPSINQLVNDVSKTKVTLQKFIEKKEKKVWEINISGKGLQISSSRDVEDIKFIMWNSYLKWSFGIRIII